MYPARVELKQKIFFWLHSYSAELFFFFCNFKFCIHTTFFYLLFFMHVIFLSPSLSSLPLHLFFLPPQIHCRSAQAQPPQNPFQPLFSIFVYLARVSALCFGLYLCFGFVFRAVLGLCWVVVLGMGFGCGFGWGVLIFLSISLCFLFARPH